MYRDADRLMLYLPQCYRARIKSIAKATGRSMSGVVVDILREKIWEVPEQPENEKDAAQA